MKQLTKNGLLKSINSLAEYVKQEEDMINLTNKNDNKFYIDPEAIYLIRPRFAEGVEKGCYVHVRYSKNPITAMEGVEEVIKLYWEAM